MPVPTEESARLIRATSLLTRPTAGPPHSSPCGPVATDQPADGAEAPGASEPDGGHGDLESDEIFTELPSYYHIDRKSPIDGLFKSDNAIHSVEMPRSHPVGGIGVLTSGGDAPGMNSALRSIVHTAIKNSIPIFGIYRGFEGLIEDDIRQLGWNSETWDSSQGGTQLHTARSDRFVESKNRKEAVYNLVRRGIDNLIVIGGDGSMAGALVLKEEFNSHFCALLREGRLERRAAQRTVDLRKDCAATEAAHGDEREGVQLRIVGIPGTIDNDIYGTELSLGADTAINRVTEIVDRLRSTARSHGRIFIIECMGNKCGWITLMAAFASSGDYILLPESPRPDWRADLKQTVRAYQNGHRQSILIFLCEGAVDTAGTSISLIDVKEVLGEYSPRALRIGHVQRGGPTSAMDAILGTVSGIKAVEYCLLDDPIPRLVAYSSRGIKLIDLNQSIEGTRRNRRLFLDGHFGELFHTRDDLFKTLFNCFEDHRAKKVQKYNELEAQKPQTGQPVYKIAHRHDREDSGIRKKISEMPLDGVEEPIRTERSDVPNIAIMNDGPRVAGMNVILNTIVEEGLSSGHNLYYFMNGFKGIRKKQRISSFELCRIKNDASVTIGTHTGKIPSLKAIKKTLRAQKIDYLIVIGGARNLDVLRQLGNAILIPVSISNDIPGSGESIGCDSAMNSLLALSKTTKDTAFSLRKTFSIVEIGDLRTNYLPMMAGLACNAFDVIAGDGETLSTLAALQKRLQKHFHRHKRSAVLILKDSKALKGLPPSSLGKILTAGTGLRCIETLAGPLANGSMPSAFDRIRGSLMALTALQAVVDALGSGITSVSHGISRFRKIDEIPARLNVKRSTETYRKFFQMFGCGDIRVNEEETINRTR